MTKDKLEIFMDNQSSLGFANLFSGLSLGSGIKNSIVFSGSSLESGFRVFR